MGQPRGGLRTGGQSPPAQTARSLAARGEIWGEQRCVTPRQTCPRPNGFGRNLRSKTRWFTGFCNSHQVSHFATFFIDARAEISVAESRSLYSYRSRGDHRGRVTVSGASMAGIVPLSFLDAFRAGVRLVPGCEGWGHHKHPARRVQGVFAPLAPLGCCNAFAGLSAGQVSTMILPQVHLRKPCYDFSFL